MFIPCYKHTLFMYILITFFTVFEFLCFFKPINHKCVDIVILLSATINFLVLQMALVFVRTMVAILNDFVWTLGACFKNNNGLIYTLACKSSRLFKRFKIFSLTLRMDLFETLHRFVTTLFIERVSKRST